MPDFLDVEDGMHKTAKGLWNSTDEQTADFITCRKSEFEMRHGNVTHRITGAEITEPVVKAWYEQHAAHYLPPPLKADLAELAFLGRGNLAARGQLLQEVGSEEANRIAQTYGLRSYTDTKPGRRPEGAAEPSKQANGSTNPWANCTQNCDAKGRYLPSAITRMGSLVKSLGPEKAAAIAGAVGSHLGATRAPGSKPTMPRPR